MITLRKIEKQDKDTILGEIVGLSTDTKPTEMGGKTVANGSSFVEMDTGNIFLFDQANEEWSQFSGGSGGGGGSTGTPTIIVNEDNDVLDIKPSDIIDENSQTRNKYFVLKIHNALSGGDNFFPIYLVNVMEGQVGIAFGDSQEYMGNRYMASISEDNYFTHFEG